MNRRLFLANMIFTSFAASACQAKPQKEIDAPFKLSDAEWKSRLTPLQYNILRHEGTEAPFTSKLLDEHGKGVFACAGCDNSLFNSNTKFDSGTGWPSFYDEIKGALGKKSDMLIGELRTAYYCATPAVPKQPACPAAPPSENAFSSCTRPRRAPSPVNDCHA